jgi:hypothetical protein
MQSIASHVTSGQQGSMETLAFQHTVLPASAESGCLEKLRVLIAEDNHQSEGLSVFRDLVLKMFPSLMTVESC